MTFLKKKWQARNPKVALQVSCEGKTRIVSFEIQIIRFPLDFLNACQNST